MAQSIDDALDNDDGHLSAHDGRKRQVQFVDAETGQLGSLKNGHTVTSRNSSCTAAQSTATEDEQGHSRLHESNSNDGGGGIDDDDYDDEESEDVETESSTDGRDDLWNLSCDDGEQTLGVFGLLMGMYVTVL